MSTTTEVNLKDRLEELLQYIREGRILDAMREFYAENVAMQENAGPPTVGLAANIEREKAFMSGVKEWKGFAVKGIGVGDGVTFYEAVFDLIAANDQPVHLEQVTVARWRDGRIVHERFYYDASGMPSGLTDQVSNVVHA